MRISIWTLIGPEQEATAITRYSMNYIPGLLQTEDYARGIITTIAPKMDPKIVEQHTEARLRRQHVLDNDGRLRYHVLLYEAVMRRGVGDAALMVAQLDKVLAAVLDGQVTVQIIPFIAGAYVAADGYFVLLEFGEDSDLWPVVFIESLTGNLYLERRADTARYRETTRRARMSLRRGEWHKFVAAVKTGAFDGL